LKSPNDDLVMAAFDLGRAASSIDDVSGLLGDLVAKVAMALRRGVDTPQPMSKSVVDIELRASLKIEGGIAKLLRAGTNADLVIRVSEAHAKAQKDVVA
jgi:hypothetical protein